jgi:hypothetical protein
LMSASKPAIMRRNTRMLHNTASRQKTTCSNYSEDYKKRRAHHAV